MSEKTNKIEEHWINMPEYNNIKQPEPLITATFKFRTEEDYAEFHNKVKELIYGGVKVFDGMQRKDKKQAWYPLNEKASNYEYR